MNSFILYWKNIEIGTLTKTNWDMRSAGHIKFKFDYQKESNENKHLSKYISHSIEANRFLEEGKIEDYNKMCEKEEEFLDLINSSDWTIKNKDGERIKILCPIFQKNDEIIWQKDYD